MATTDLLLGNDPTAANNLILRCDGAGGGSIRKGDGTALVTLPSTGGVVIGTTQSMVRLNTANGYGSTNTRIRRFTNVVTNQGTDITYADSAANGASFTINAAGVYAISYNDQFSGSGFVGVSLNSSQLTTNIYSITVSDVVCVGFGPAAGAPACCGAVLYLSAGSVIRAHTDASVSGSNTTMCQFTITRVA